MIRKLQGGQLVTLEGRSLGEEKTGDVDINAWTKLAETAAGLKGIKLKDAAAIGILAVSPVLGPFGLAIGAVMAGILKFLGIKGKTVHVDYDTAERLAVEFAGNALKVWDALPVDGRAYLSERVQAFHTTMLQKFGSWWDGALNAQYASHKSKGLYVSDRERLFYQVMGPAFIIIRNCDGQTVESDFQRWYVNENWKPIVVDPVTQYCATRFNQVIEMAKTGQITTGGGGPIEAAMASGIGAVVLLVGGALFLLSGKNKKGNR